MAGSQSNEEPGQAPAAAPNSKVFATENAGQLRDLMALACDWLWEQDEAGSLTLLECTSRVSASGFPRENRVR